MFWTVRLRILVGPSLSILLDASCRPSVSLVYRGATEDELVDADDAAYDCMVDRRLEQFFGAKDPGRAPSIGSKLLGQRGDEACGSTDICSGSRGSSNGLTTSRPPVTRIRDVRYGLEHYNGRKPDTIELTRRRERLCPHSIYRDDRYPAFSAMRGDFSAKDDDDEDLEKPFAPPYYFIGPVSLQWKGQPV